MLKNIFHEYHNLLKQYKQISRQTKTDLKKANQEHESMKAEFFREKKAINKRMSHLK